MKNILFPTDFSPTSENAFVYALHLANQLNAKLTVFHHFEMPVISSSHAGTPELMGSVYETIELNHFEEFKKEVENLRAIAEEKGLSQVEMSFVLEEGLFVSNVEYLVEKESIDLIVMGTNGANNLEKKILGTNAVRVLENVKIPVLSIPTEANFQKIEKIGFATSLKESNKEYLRQIISLARAIGAKVEVLHVVKKEEDTTFDAILNPWIEEFGLQGVAFQTAVSQDIESGLFYLIDNYDIDVLVTVKRKMNFLEKLFKYSVSNELNTHSYVPVFTFKE